MKNLLGLPSCLRLAAIFISMMALPAFAQEPPAAGSPIAAEIPAPSAAPAAPAEPAAFAAPEASPQMSAPPTPAVGTASYFPPLPQSRLCKTEEIPGVWKLQMVYENPLGQGAIGFSAQPYQYLTLNADGTYTEYKTNYPEDESTIPARLLNQRSSTAMQQYIVQETGFMYFYRDSIATDTQACFIVVAARGQFTPGEMLLMPPEGTTTTRLVKIYKRLTPPPAAASAAAPAPARSEKPFYEMTPAERRAAHQQRRLQQQNRN